MCLFLQPIPRYRLMLVRYGALAVCALLVGCNSSPEIQADSLRRIRTQSESSVPAPRQRHSEDTDSGWVLVRMDRSGNWVHEDIPLLHSALLQQKPNEVERLIAEGADVNATIENGYTPLHLAAGRRDAPLIEVLLKHGANVNAADQRGATPLHSAVLAGDTTVVRMLLNHGADINATTEVGHTPLRGAVSAEQWSIARILIEEGADVNAGHDRRFGNSPLHMAMALRNVEMCRYLLEHGAEVSAANHRGRTPLHLVWIFLDDTAVAELLLEHGADVNATDDTDRTPMDTAKRLDLERLTSLLKRHGAK